VSAADRAIRVSTAVAVLGVAGIAAYVSYWHAFEVVRAHGESGVTARLEPATIDGLVYASSMVILYAARHRLPVPGLARWLLALGILATLAANVAHGWAHGPLGAAVAAWPAASLVGSYELLLWLIRTAADDTAVRQPSAHQASGPANHPVADLRLVPVPDLGVREERDSSAKPGGLDDNSARRGIGPNRACGPDWYGGSEAYQPADQEAAKGSLVNGDDAVGDDREMYVDAAAVAAYRASLDAGTPLSERKLAAKFGKTSRRWARHRMAEAMGRAVG
jgi:Protein of unknown function (DUF2637)